MRFKIGDKVRIKDECVANNYYDGLWFNKEMEKFKDKELTIQKISGNHYWIAEATYTYNDEMLEPFDFKVGDEVVFIESNLNCYKKVGIIANIKKIEKNKFNIIIQTSDNIIQTSDNTLDELLQTIQLLKDFEATRLEIEPQKIKIKKDRFALSTGGTIQPDNIGISILYDDDRIDAIQYALNYKEKGENKMDILEIYKVRKLKEIDDKFYKEKDEIMANDEVHKIIKETENRLNVLLNKDEDNEVELDFNEYEPNTYIKLEELKFNKSKKIEELNSLIEEVKAQLEISDSYVTTIEIYKNYGILNKEGKIYNGEKSKK